MQEVSDAYLAEHFAGYAAFIAGGGTKEDFIKAKDADGNYRCACCGVADKSRIYFQVDHIVPMNNGGKSVVENLQILCRQCNGTKGDQ